MCRLIGHRRSAKRVWFDREVRRWRSRCRRCGTQLEKHGLYGWREI